MRSVAAAAGLLAAGLYLAGLAFPLPPLLRLACKPLPVVALAFWVAPAPRDAYARLVRAGLLASAVGDVCLELPGRFLQGLGAFLLAHVLYTAAFLIDVRRPALRRALPFAVWGVLAFAVLRPGLGALERPVLLYLVAILAMMWRAAARVGATARGPASALAAAAGAVLFGLSDTLIALDRFHAEIPGVRWPIMLLYWAGQLGLAGSARRSSDDSGDVRPRGAPSG